MIIDQALPARELPVRRDTLVQVIAAHVRRWKLAEPEVAPFAEKIRMLTATNDRLMKAIEEAGGELLKLGVAEDIKRITEENRAIGIDPPGQAIGGRSATVDLYLVAHQAIDGLRRGIGSIGPRKGAPKAFQQRWLLAFLWNVSTRG